MLSHTLCHGLQLFHISYICFSAASTHDSTLTWVGTFLERLRKKKPQSHQLNQDVEKSLANGGRSKSACGNLYPAAQELSVLDGSNNNKSSEDSGLPADQSTCASADVKDPSSRPGREPMDREASGSSIGTSVLWTTPFIALKLTAKLPLNLYVDVDATFLKWEEFSLWVSVSLTEQVVA